MSILKLYFLLGLPGETDSDIDAIPILTRQVADTAGKDVRISLSVNFFIPKPGSPWGGEPLLPEKDLRRRLRRLRHGLQWMREMDINTMAPWEAVLQTLLSRGGSEVGQLILDAVNKGASHRDLLRSTPPEMLDKYVHSRL